MSNLMANFTKKQMGTRTQLYKPINSPKPPFTSEQTNHPIDTSRTTASQQQRVKNMLTLLSFNASNQ